QVALVVELPDIAAVVPVVSPGVRVGGRVLPVAVEERLGLGQDLAVLGDPDGHARDGGADRTEPGVVDRVDREPARRFRESVTLEEVEARASEEVAETLAERAATGDHAIALAAEGVVQLAVHQRREDLVLE